MKMYIANCTTANQDFQARIPEAGVVRQLIPSGEQILIPTDLNTLQIEAIVQQHAPYGLININEIERTNNFTGQVYSLDKKVDMDRVRRVLEKNFSVLDARGKKIRQEAAVAVNDAVERQVQNTGAHSTIREMEFSVQEVEKNGVDTQVNESITVSRTKEPQTASKSRRK